MEEGLGWEFAFSAPVSYKARADHAYPPAAKLSCPNCPTLPHSPCAEPDTPDTHVVLGHTCGGQSSTSWSSQAPGRRRTCWELGHVNLKRLVAPSAAVFWPDARGLVFCCCGDTSECSSSLLLPWIPAPTPPSPHHTSPSSPGLQRVQAMSSAEATVGGTLLPSGMFACAGRQAHCASHPLVPNEMTHPMCSQAQV